MGERVFCKNCKYFTKFGGELRCKREGALDVAGYPKVSVLYERAESDGKDTCGREGKYYQKKEYFPDWATPFLYTVMFMSCVYGVIIYSCGG